jgi:hypothetical protein
MLDAPGDAGLVKSPEEGRRRTHDLARIRRCATSRKKFLRGAWQHSVDHRSQIDVEPEGAARRPGELPGPEGDSGAGGVEKADGTADEIPEAVDGSSLLIHADSWAAGKLQDFPRQRHDTLRGLQISAEEDQAPRRILPEHPPFLLRQGRPYDADAEEAARGLRVGHDDGAFSRS